MMATSALPTNIAGGAVVVKRGQGPRKAHSMQLASINFGQIVKEHSLGDVVRKANHAYLRELPAGCITLHGLALLVDHAPLHVIEERDGVFVCIGGLRLFRLLKKAFKDADVIHVVVHENLSPELLQRHIEVDLLLIPALFGLHHKDRRLLATAWDGLIESPFSKMLEHPGWDGVAHILACDLRPPKAKKGSNEIQITE